MVDVNVNSKLNAITAAEPAAEQSALLLLDNAQSHLHSEPHTLTWSNVRVTTALPRPRFQLIKRLCSKKPADDDKAEDALTKTIISDVSGVARPREVLALMGSSGAGKTTMLNVLNFRNRTTLQVEGDVRVNGRLVRSTEEIATLSGYVQQTDLFIQCLTVRESLVFQAMLRMDKKTTHAERLERVEEVLNDLNLKKCENTPIQIGSRGISGGERRRLSFACEIITNPSILFCDEPTSGLDSFMAASIVETMKSLARQGKTIVCTIHQPSSEVFEMFDRLCLLAEGRLAYIGDRAEANAFFASQGHHVPLNYNPSDYFIKTLSIVPADRERCVARVESICEGFRASSMYEENAREIEKALELAADEQKKPEEGNLFNKLLLAQPRHGLYKANFFQQMRWLLWRNYISQIRNPFALRIQIVQSVLIAIIFGLIYFQLELSQEGIQNINGVLFLCMTNNSFSSMFVVVNMFPAELLIFYREHQNGMYRVASYYLAKVFLDLPTFIILPFVFTTICYWMADLNHDFARFFICTGIVILVAQISVSFGTFLSAAAPSTDSAMALSGPLLVPLMIFSGYLLNLESVPKYFIFMRYLSWFGYANEAMVLNQWEGVTGIKCDEGSLNCFSTGKEVIEFLKMKPEHFYTNVLCMALIMLGWRIMAFVVLLIKSRK